MPRFTPPKEDVPEMVKDMDDHLAYISRCEEKWRDCVIAYNHPKRMYKTMYPHDDLPIDAEDYDEEFVASYGDFEDENFIVNDDRDSLLRKMSQNKVFVKNNVYRDMASDIATISRVELNWDDGFVQHNVIAGSKVNPETLQGSWFDTVNALDPAPNTENKMFIPKMYATSAYDIAFGKNKIGKSDYFFETRENFDSYFMDDPASSGCLLIDNPINPEFIGFKSKLNGVYAFNDIMSYANATGIMFADVCSMSSMIIYFVQEVINLLIPKQIVLVMDSYRGLIDIPRQDYIPNIADPVKNIPDYDNKMRHIINMMKQIVSGQMFYTRMGQFYLKLSITPALTVINFISALAPNVRLVLSLPTIDNQILYDVEVVNNEYPVKYTQELGPYWHQGRNHENDRDVLMTIQANYHDKLIGIKSDELAEYMQSNHGINVPRNHVFQQTKWDDIPF